MRRPYSAVPATLRRPAQFRYFDSRPKYRVVHNEHFPILKLRGLTDLRNLERNTIDISYWYTKLDLSGGLIDLPEKNGQNLFATNATVRTTGDLQRFHMVTTH